MAPRQFSEEREIWCGLKPERRDRHQSGERERRSANRIHQFAHLADRAAALLFFLADVHLNVDSWTSRLPLRLFSEWAEKRRTIERVDRVEQPHRLRRLVRLETPDPVHSNTRIPLSQGRPFGERLLDTTFAKVALTGRDQFLDLLNRATLADGNQLDARGIATGDPRGCRDALQDLLSAVCSAGHERAIESVMKRRQTSVPRQWLIADTRLGDRLWKAIRELPRGTGLLIILRDLSASKRERVIRRLAYLAAARGLMLIDEAEAAARVHDSRELRRALLRRVPLILLSPIYPTRSHPDWRPIPRMRAAAYARLADRRLIALGGMDRHRFRRVERLGFIGWAGVGAWLG
jgi:thiamine-phosphate pyrophosphorylase